MQIECPSCLADNKIEFGKNILCSECNKTFAGHAYKKFKKPILSVTAALFVGAFGFHKVDDNFFNDSRYPLSVEYELIDSCVNSSNLAMSYARLKEKKTVCICALSNTMKEVRFNKINGSETEFASHFRKNVASCS